MIRVSNDVTHLKEVEQQLVIKQKNLELALEQQNLLHSVYENCPALMVSNVHGFLVTHCYYFYFLFFVDFILFILWVLFFFLY